jgi:lipopolysaccharide/colanic/teichoic acid biosynthesis glycosyltransferase
MYQFAGSSIGKASLSSADLGISYAEPASWPICGWRGAVKRLIDIAVALLGLILLSLPFLVTALAIRLESPGDSLLRQRRTGFANVSFDMWKFRTMHEHASEPGWPIQATRNDKRVTRLGNVLRQLSIDELPQLLNVLHGDMSLVGPRPHMPGTRAGDTPFEMVTPYYAERHRVRPGMTGLAQARGWRGETETEEKLLHRVESDLEYIDNWSLWLDFVILARTIMPVLTARNAY